MIEYKVGRGMRILFVGIERVLRDIRTFRPRVVCFIGKVTYNVFHGSTECDYGW